MNAHTFASLPHYRPTGRECELFELAHATPPMRRLVSQAMPVLRRFARESEQACHLVIHDRNILVVVAQVDIGLTLHFLLRLEHPIL